MNAHTNPFVEAWGYKREHIEKTFRFTPKTLTAIALGGVLFPLLIYKVQIREFVRALGRRLSAQLPNSASRGFRAQDKVSKRKHEAPKNFL